MSGYPPMAREGSMMNAMMTRPASEEVLSACHVLSIAAGVAQFSLGIKRDPVATWVFETTSSGKDAR